ncbi:MAG: flagellar motor protein MotB [Thermodesulfobacteriota bacterium]
MEGQPIIVKKVKKVVHGGHHGGSWKVAYADFVTAMMAFFLLMWLVTMVSPEKRAGVSYYFKHFNIFEKSGISFVQSHLTGKVSTMDQQAFGKVEIEEEGTEIEVQRRKAYEEALKQEIESRLADVKDQILVNLFENGVRVEIVEKSSSAMFPLGSSVMNENGKRILSVLTKVIREGDRKIAIEGHTDALAFSTAAYSNWELSTERASAARREMERNGFPTNRLMRVTGFADTQPLIAENPSDPRNRRISILIFDQPKQVQVISPPDISTRRP